MKRVFWRAYAIVAALVFGFFVALVVGPYLENAVAPVRAHQSIEAVRRVPGFVSFIWVSRKLRMRPSPGVDVTMEVPRDVFDLAFEKDFSLPGEPPCTRHLPWARSSAVGLGDHRQAMCVEIPATVQPTDAIHLRVVVKYLGLLGLWILPTHLPEFDLPAS